MEVSSEKIEATLLVRGTSSNQVSASEPPNSELVGENDAKYREKGIGAGNNEARVGFELGLRQQGCRNTRNPQALSET